MFPVSVFALFFRIFGLFQADGAVFFTFDGAVFFTSIKNIIINNIRIIFSGFSEE